MGRRLVRGRGYRVRRGIIQIRGGKARLVRGVVRLVRGRLVRVRVRIKTTKATHYVGEVIPQGHSLVPHPTPQHGVVGGGTACVARGSCLVESWLENRTQEGQGQW